MLVMVTLAAVRLTVPVNQAEETSRQLHIAQLATATYIVIYRVILFNWSRSKGVVLLYYFVLTAAKGSFYI